LVCIFLFIAYFLDNLFPCVAGTIIIFFLFSCLIFRFCILILFYGLLIVRLDLVLTLKQVNWNNNIWSVSSPRFILLPLLWMQIILISFFICWFLFSTGFAPLWFTTNTFFSSYECCKTTIHDFWDFFVFGTAWSSLLCWSATWFKEFSTVLSFCCFPTTCLLQPNFNFHLGLRELVLHGFDIPQKFHLFSLQLWYSDQRLSLENYATWYNSQRSENGHI
jgi:hypothetical protein